MLTEKQFKIFEVFAKKPFAELVRNQIKKEAEERSNNKLALTINLLKKQRVLIEKKIGKSGVLTLNLENDLSFFYIALINHKKLSKITQSALDLLNQEISDQTIFYTLVIFGSYAEGTQQKNSDLDIAVFIENEETKSKIDASINSVKQKSLVVLDVHVITKKEMLEMLTTKEENLGKQIARKHIAVYNNRIFYEILKQGMRNGFRT